MVGNQVIYLLTKIYGNLEFYLDLSFSKFSCSSFNYFEPYRSRCWSFEKFSEEFYLEISYAVTSYL
jgi:hypothetical protein